MTPQNGAALIPSSLQTQRIDNQTPMAELFQSITRNEGEKPSEKGSLGIIFTTVFIDLIGFSIIFPLFPSMLEYYLGREGPGSLLTKLIGWLDSMTLTGSSDTSFYTTVFFGGILGSIYSLLQFVFSPIWGSISDRYGRRPVLIFTLAGTALSYLIWIFSGSFLLLVISRILGGVMSGNLAVATAAVADVTSKENRSSGMVVIGIAFGLGFIIGPAIGGFSSLIDLTHLDPRLENFGINPFSFPALFAFVLAAANLVWAICRFKESLPHHNRISSISLYRIERFTGIFSKGGTANKKTNLIYFIYITAFSGLEFTLTFLALERLHYNPEDNVWMFVFIGIILILTQGGIVRKLAPKTGERHLARAGFISGMAAFVFLAFAGGSIPFYAGLALIALSAGLVTPTLSALASLYSTEREQGSNLGTFRSAGALARTVGPLLAATIFWLFGSGTSYICGAFVLIIPLLLSWHLPAPDKQEATSP